MRPEHIPVMSRFFAASAYNDDDDFGGLSSSSDEESLRSISSDSSMDLSSSEDSDDSFFNDSDESESSDEGGRNYDDDSDSKPYGPDWFKKSQYRKGPPQNKFLKSVESSDESNLSSDNDGQWDSDMDNDEGGKKVVKSARDKLLDEMKTILNYISKAGIDQSNSTQLLDNFDLLLRLQIRSIQQNFGTPPVFIETLIKYNEFIKDLDSKEDDLQFDNKSVAKAYNVLKQRVKKSIKENQQFINEDGNVAISAMEAAISQVPLLSGSGTTNLISTQTTTSSNFQDLLENTSSGNYFETLQAVIDSRGKKNVQSSDLISVLNGLLNIESISAYQKIMTYLTLIPIRLESSQQLSYQPIDQWNETFVTVANFMSLLEENISKYHVSEFAKYNDNLPVEPEPVNGLVPILGSIFAFVERLDDEFNKSLLNTDPHSSDYLLRLKDETKLYTLLIRVQLYLEKVYLGKHPLALNRIIIKRLNHIYYKSQPIAFKLEKLVWKNISYSSSSIIAFSEDKDYVTNLINTLIECIASNIKAGKKSNEVNNFATDVEDDIIRSNLFKIYYHALNLTYDFTEIKQMLITLNVNKVRSQSTSTSLQILFNRVVVQLGLCAFKSSLIEECHEVLNELLSSSHLREILGQQSLQRILHHQSTVGNNNTNINLIATEQCLPYHKHINLDLVDIVFMTCSLIIEVPQITAFYSGIKIKKTPYTARSIRRILEHFNKQNYQPPAESSRDLIIFSAKAMQSGDWTKCYEYLLKIKVWNQLLNHEEILEHLQKRIKLESLRTYLFTYKRFYSNISIKQLSDRFQLPEDTILEEIPKVLKNMEITSIKLNDSNDFIVFDKTDEITKLEEVAIKLNKEYKITKERLFPPRH